MPENRNRVLDIDTRAVRRGVLVFTAGGLLSLVGFAMTTNEFLAAARKYVRSMPEPPSSLARRHASLARQAALAGATAWRQANGAVRTDDRVAVVDLTEGAGTESGIRS